MSEQMIETPADFGNFRLERELGHGGMGGVYLGRDKMLDRPVAIKVMLKELGDDPTFTERFQREAQAAAKLNHSNIAQIYSFGTQDGMPYIAMELCTGGSLDKKMEEQPGQLDPVWVMTIGKALAEGLSVSANQGLVHGDIKPENVLFDAEGNPKIVDFGLAAMQGDTGEIWGTPYYISPEKCRKQVVDYRADIYSLGGTLYHAITGVPPFEGEDATAVVKARFEGAPKKPSEVREGLAPEIDEIIMRMLEVEPGARYPTFESLLGDMKRYLEKAGPVKTQASSRIKLKGRKSKVKLTTGAETSTSAETLVTSLEEESEEEEKKGLGVGAIIGIVAGGIVLLIGLVVGGLFWYLHAEKVAQEKAHQREIVQKQEQARAAINKTLKAVSDAGVHFHDLVKKATDEAEKARTQLKNLVPEEMKEVAMPLLDPEPTKEYYDAIAYTNELYVAAAAKAAVEANARAAEEAAEAAATNRAATVEGGTNAAPAQAAAGTTNAAPAQAVAPAASNAAPVKAAAPATSNAAPVKAAAPAPAVAPAAAAPAIAATPAPAAPAVAIPEGFKDLAKLWEDVWFCKATDMRVAARVALLLKEGEKVALLKGQDVETTKKLAALSQQLVEELDAIKGMKCYEQTLRKCGVIKSKSGTLVKTITVQFAKLKAKAEREAAAKAAAEAKAAKEAKEKAEYEARAAVQVKHAEELYEKFAKTLIPRLAFDTALKQMNALLNEDRLTTEGRDAARLEIKKIEYMALVQKHFIKNGRKFKYVNRNTTMTVKQADAKGITFVTETRVKNRLGRESVKRGEPEKFTWNKLYLQQHGRMNRLIIELIEKGRETTKVGGLEWSKLMLGAAMTMKTLYADDLAIPKRVAGIVGTAAEKFAPCRKDAKKMFPDVEVPDSEEE